MRNGLQQTISRGVADAPYAAGFLEGYLTMDSLAALVFGIVVIDSLRSRGIRDQRRCEALCEVIVEIGELLADRFPPGTDDRNELEDLVILAGPGAGGRLIIR